MKIVMQITDSRVKQPCKFSLELDKNDGRNDFW